MIHVLCECTLRFSKKNVFDNIRLPCASTESKTLFSETSFETDLFWIFELSYRFQSLLRKNLLRTLSAEIGIHVSYPNSKVHFVMRLPFLIDIRETAKRSSFSNITLHKILLNSTNQTKMQNLPLNKVSRRQAKTFSSQLKELRLLHASLDVMHDEQWT